MGQAQNGTGVMAEQMEIHPGCNDVINAAESTFPPRMGKPSRGSSSHEEKALVRLVLSFFFVLLLLFFFTSYVFSLSCEQDNI